MMLSANPTRIDEFNFMLRDLLAYASLPFVFSSHSKNVCRFQLKQHGG